MNGIATPTIGTVSGKEISYLNPDPMSIDIQDIAVGLSNVCRFAGQLETHYSVAQHSCAVASKVWCETTDPQKAMQGLLHDASEAYTGDVPTPLKRAVGTAFCEIETRLQSVIYEKYGVPVEMFPEVHEADKRWLITERNTFQPRHFEWGAYRDILPYGELDLKAWKPKRARKNFIAWFEYFECLQRKLFAKAS